MDKWHRVGALAVEMMASVIQHPDGIASPASNAKLESANVSERLPLGYPPHMLRGQLGSFSQQALTGRAPVLKAS